MQYYDVTAEQWGVVMSDKVIGLMILAWIIFIAFAATALTFTAIYGLWLFLQSSGA